MLDQSGVPRSTVRVSESVGWRASRRITFADEVVDVVDQWLQLVVP